jgi:hypothetical protein
VQICLREVIHAVALIRIDQGDVREHRVEIRPANLDAVREQHAEVELEIVTDLLDAFSHE